MPKELILDLVRIQRQYQVHFSKEKILEMLRKEWPELTETETWRITVSSLKLYNAISFLENHFPRGTIPPRQVAGLNKSFDETVLVSAAKELNGERSEVGQKNVIAFPKIINFFNLKKIE